MSSAATLVTQSSPMRGPGTTCIKSLAESGDLKSIPSNYAYSTDPSETLASDPDEDDSLPIIDFSLLTSDDDPHQRSKIIQDLGDACRHWGFFLLKNHGVSEGLMKGEMDACQEFFNLTEEEKREYAGKHVLDPIRCGTSFNTAVEKVLFWRDFLKVIVHPHFHFPNRPTGFSEISMEYCKRCREVSGELLKGISESLGLQQCYIDKALQLDSACQIFIANLYPPCPQSELAMGLPRHSDHSLLTLLAQNEVGGLQLHHHGRWINVNAPPNSLMVIIGDQLEILSNGRYKSVVHRAVVNNKATRMSIGTAYGPSLDTIVSPAPELLHNHSTHPPAYMPIKYFDYIHLQQSNQLLGKSTLDHVRLQFL